VYVFIAIGREFNVYLCGQHRRKATGIFLVEPVATRNALAVAVQLALILENSANRALGGLQSWIARHYQRVPAKTRTREAVALTTNASLKTTDFGPVANHLHRENDNINIQLLFGRDALDSRGDIAPRRRSGAPTECHRGHS
jgi:hypothetical protein